LSLKLALKALRDLGLTDIDARLYVHLAKKGPQEQNSLADALRVKKHQLSLSLESLLARGIIGTIPEDAIRYFAVPFEKVLDEFIKTAKEQAKTLKASREELLSTWRAVNDNISSNS
jgi:sugar-specific transcriptional regulator TrmB